MNITMATYNFARCEFYITKHEVVRETKKCYFTKTKYKREHRFLKEEIGKAKHLSGNPIPYLEVIMIDATEEELKEKIAGWFEQRASKIKNYKCE